MGKVVQGTQMSEQNYRIDVPQPKSTLPPRNHEFVPAAFGHDVNAVISASHRIVDDSATDARSLINDARERAKTIVGKALEMASELETKGYDDGLARATAEQNDVLRDVVSEARTNLQAIVDKVRDERRQFFLDAERELIDLACAIAKKIVQHEIEHATDTAVHVTRAALKRLSERDRVTIRVSPHDLDCVRDQREAFLTENDIDDLKIIADPRVDHGGVIIETESGSIDGRIEAQLEVANEALRSLADSETISDGQE